MSLNLEQLQNNSDYFTSYEDLSVHELMLTDLPRQEAYRRAIFENKNLFQNKIVLDVGSGTGILSIFCAQAGASKVLAVEASNVAKLSKKIIEDNGFSDKIEVYQTKIENFCLPEGLSKVDIIISEWMGFYLLHEGMLDSVIYARDKFLKSGGLMFPETASIYVSPCSVPSHFDAWENVTGVNMSSFARQLRLEKSSKPEIMVVNHEDLLHEGTVLAWIDLRDVSTEDLSEFNFKEVIVVQKPGKYEGVCLWFYCSFPDQDNENQPVVLSTSPKNKPTHWKQTVLLLPDVARETMETGEPIAINLQIKRNAENPRRYGLELELLDPEKIEHNLPCECIMTKCILTKKHFELMETDNPE